jgi:endonuclease YncB( thermonuclease family)
VGFVVQFQANNFTSSVVSILDGDTIEVLNGRHTERIRLSGIDCPEKGQAFGQRAKQTASECASVDWHRRLRVHA